MISFLIRMQLPLNATTKHRATIRMQLPLNAPTKYFVTIRMQLRWMHRPNILLQSECSSPECSRRRPSSVGRSRSPDGLRTLIWSPLAAHQRLKTLSLPRQLDASTYHPRAFGLGRVALSPSMLNQATKQKT